MADPSQDVIKGSIAHSQTERREIRARTDEIIEMTNSVLRKDSTLYLASCNEVR